MQQDSSPSPIPDQGTLRSLISFRCTQEAASSLIAPITAAEIKQTLFAMPRNKSPGPDGFTVEFFVSCWGSVGNDFTTAIQSFFSNGFMPSGVNATKLILLPKSDSAETMKDYRPIACCNTSYKVISKIIANRLKLILPDAIQKNQCAFVKGRLLLENVLLATELVKNYHRKNISERCVLKLDISKAFDSVRWDFIKAVLLAMDLPERFINWIMNCICSASFSVFLNGNLEGFFTSSRGIRQGCSMSPYIFVIIMNVLSLSLNAASESGCIGYHPYCKDLKLNHLCFADDLMVFMKGNAESLMNTAKVLEDFHLMSGLNINASKSSIYFGGIAQRTLINKARELGFPILNLPIRYLGLPLTTKNMTKADFAPLIERVKKRMMSWSSRMLSYAGRLQLIKAVIKSITDFWCSAFRLPSKCFSMIDGLCSAFLWSGSPLISSKAKVSWAEICAPKTEGGLGLRKTSISSQVFSLSLIWRLLSCAGSLWVAWVNRYLLHGSNFWDVKLTTRGSWIWRKLLRLRPLVQRFIYHEVRSGNNTLFWLDNWMNKQRLIELLGEDGIRRMGVRRLATVSEVVTEGGWSFNRSRDPMIRGTIREISLLTPPDPNGPPDRVLWRHAESTFKEHFSAKKTWFLLHNLKPQVPWHRAIWFGQAIPRHAFISWMTVRNRLSTGDRVAKWGWEQDCKLCGERLETRSHLFFACPFSFTIWNALSGSLLRRTNPDWNTTLSDVSRRSKNKTDSLLLRLAFQATIYHIWRERNYRRHNMNRHLVETIISFIRQEIKNRILSLGTEIHESILTRWMELS